MMLPSRFFFGIKRVNTDFKLAFQHYIRHAFHFRNFKEKYSRKHVILLKIKKRRIEEKTQGMKKKPIFGCKK